MSQRVRNNIEALCFLSACNKKQQRAVIQNGGGDLIDSVSECVLNVLKGHIHLTPTQKKKLSSYKKDLRMLTDKKLNLKHKKNIW